MKRDQLSQTNAQLYDGYAVPMHSLEVQQFAELMAVETPGRVLDLGCADGQFAEHIGRLGWTSYGNDISKTNAALANTRGVRALVADLHHSFPYRSDCFDAVLAKQICEHLMDTRQFFKECQRVLKPGGMLIIGTPNFASLSNRLRLLFGLYPTFMDYEMEGGYGHVRYYTLNVLCDQLRGLGFKVIAVRGGVLPLPLLDRIIQNRRFKPAEILGDLFPALSHNLVVKVQKV
jgi:SAM-dependent methyltransferase